jgi:hypothetical protein
MIRPAAPLAALALLALLAVLTVPTAGLADQRPYAFTYPAVTAPRGALDLEVTSTLSDPRGAPRAWEHQLELEYGLTDRWDVAVYGVFARPQREELKAEALKLESRYRLADAGEWPVDVVAYLELQRLLGDEKGTSIEAKLILAKDVGRANFSVNLSAEQEFVPGETELEWGWAAGTSWELHPALRVGAETFGDARSVDGDTIVEAFAGPAIGVSLPFQAGALHGTWLALTAGIGLTPDSDHFRVRGIVSFQF